MPRPLDSNDYMALGTNGTDWGSGGIYGKDMGVDGLVDELIKDTSTLNKAVGGEYVQFTLLNDMIDVIREFAFIFKRVTDVIFLSSEESPFPVGHR